MSHTVDTGQETDAVLYSLTGSIAEARLNRPAKLNPLSTEMVDGLSAAVERAYDDGAAVLILRGNGRAFMAGGDLQRLAKIDPASGVGLMIGTIHRCLERMAAAPFITIAAVHGPVAGAGLSIAMNADLAIAADDARFTMAYARIGASPDCGGTYALPRLVGLRRAMEIALFADDFCAEEAERIGIVNRVVPADQLDDAVSEMARRLARGPRQAQARTKALLRQSLDNDLNAQLRAEETAFRASTATPEFKEGVSAFLEKRKPTFGGG